MKRDITEDEYNFLKIFPRNKNYVKFEKIRRRTKTFSDDKFYKVAQNMHYIEYVNGDLHGVGLRILEDGIDAVKKYRKENVKWYKSTEIWIKIIGLLTVLLGLLKVLLG